MHVVNVDNTVVSSVFLREEHSFLVFQKVKQSYNIYFREVAGLCKQPNDF